MSAPTEHGQRTTRALDQYEEAAHMLMLVASSAPDVEPRPPWWRPLARYRHLVEHDDQLALWAESVETFAEELTQAESGLDAARRADDLRECLR